jgi:hypothetical protein
LSAPAQRLRIERAAILAQCGSRFVMRSRLSDAPMLNPAIVLP